MGEQDLKKMIFLFEASKSVFYECFNAISICTRDLQWYWSCNKSQGCENDIGHRGYCFVCQIVDIYCADDFKKVKYNPVKLFKLPSEFFKDVKLSYELDPPIDFWLHNFEFEWRDIALGEMGSVYLKDCDYF